MNGSRKDARTLWEVKQHRLFLIVALLAASLIAGCGTPKIFLFVDETEPLREYTLQGKEDGKVLLLPITGVISDVREKGFLQPKPSMLQEVVSQLQKAAQDGDPRAFDFPRAWLEDSWNFSFSGLKTAVLRDVRRLESTSSGVYQPALPVANLAASFQAAVVDVLVGKTLRAADQYNVKDILVAGGVSANQALREAFQEQASIPVYIPPIELCTDNAAMIAAAGYFRYITGQRDTYDMDVLPNWPLSEL